MKVLPENEFKYNLTYQGETTELVFAPVGWDNDTIGQLSRDEGYGGVLRTLSFPLEFSYDGFAIIQQAFLENGYEAEVILEVLRLNRTTFIYERLYYSELDFSQYDNNGTTVKVILMEGGASKVIKAKENNKYEYALTGTDVVNMILPGVVFSESAQSIFTNGGQSDRFMPSIDLVINDTNSKFVTVQNVEQEENITDDNIFSASDNWFIMTNRDQTVTISGRLVGGGFKPPLGNGNDFAILVKDNNNNTVRTLFQSPSMNPGDLVSFNFDFTFDIDMAKGQKLFIYVRTDVIPSDLKVTIGEGDLNVNYTAKSDPSNCKGIKAIDLYKRILKRIDPTIISDSFLFRNDWANLIITSGNAIRELEDAVIQTTFLEFFKMANAIESAGFGLEQGKAVLEKLPYFYRNIKSASLGVASKCNFTVATDKIFNSVQVGYNDGNTDDTDGQYEYNSLQEWALAITRIQRKEDWVSPYRADQYGIEKLRVDFVKKTNDTSGDNDVFMIDCYLDGENYRPILGSTYMAVSGMPSNEAGQGSYNLRLTPKKNLLRHASYLRSIYDKMDNRYIEFGSAEKNKDLITIDSNGIRVAEKETIAAASLGGKYFKPIIATISVAVPRDIIDSVTTLPFGWTDFVWKDKTYKGYILDLGIDLAKNSEREVKLLMTDDNEL